MQLDAIEARGFRALCGCGEQARQRLRQIADVRQLNVGDAFAIAEAQRFPFLRREHALELVFAQRTQALAHRGIRQRRIAQGGAMPVGDGEKPLEEFSRFRPPTHGEKVDELHEQPGAAAAGAPHAFDQAPQAGQKTIVADAQ